MRNFARIAAGKRMAAKRKAQELWVKSGDHAKAEEALKRKYTEGREKPENLPF